MMRFKTLFVGAFFFLLAGCAASTPYTDTCQLIQPDKTGVGYTTGTFPCTLRHVAEPEGAKPQ